jgi:Fungal specific transcription factor domain
MQLYKHENAYRGLQSQSFQTLDPISSQQSSISTTSSIASSRPTGDPTTNTALVRNAILVNNVQSQSTLQRAIHSFSKDFRLRGQPFTIESILSPLINSSKALKHSIFANFILQADQVRRLPASSMPRQDLSSLQVRHYNAAITQLETTFNNPLYTDANVGAALILAFYNLCAGDLEHWTTQIRNAAEQIRLRGKTLKTHPLSLHTKFLFTLYLRTDTVASNSVGRPATADREIVDIVYSGAPISNPGLLHCRIELELLLAEISVFQYECLTFQQLGTGWNKPYRQEILRHKYDDLIDRLGKWDGLYSDLVAFEEAQDGGYPHGAALPPEMGLPLLCLVSLEIVFY